MLMEEKYGEGIVINQKRMGQNLVLLYLYTIYKSKFSYEI
jgi:hypothetical protein